jgi:hypothetical protein
VDLLTQKMLEMYQSTNKTYVDIAKELGYTSDVVQGRLSRLFKKQPELNNRNSKKSVKFDPIDYKELIRFNLQLLVPGSKCAVISDSDFRRHLKISTYEWDKLKNIKEFKTYQLIIDNNLYWCQPETKSYLKSKIELADEVFHG